MSAGLALGTPISALRRMPACLPTLPPLISTPQHTVLFQDEVNFNEVPESCSKTKLHDVDIRYVVLPFPEKNLDKLADNEREIERRWDLIQKSLSQPIHSSIQLEEAIRSYNSENLSKWDFAVLHTFFEKTLQLDESKLFFKKLLPAMVDLALQLPFLCPQSVPLLQSHRTHSLTFSQKQIASLLANAFFCTFQKSTGTSHNRCPDINFHTLFSTSKRGSDQRKYEKLRCILNYFQRITNLEPEGTVTFTRQFVEYAEFPCWETSDRTFNSLHVTVDGKIEDEGFGMLQVDFASRFVGGGVLKSGCVQEEIRFIICPELIVARLFTECLTKGECLIVTGCERYSQYGGYANQFTYSGNYEDLTPRDSWGRRCVQIVAIDATRFQRGEDQFQPEYLLRELNKAFCGFYSPGTLNENLPAVATGNWGCGVYKGNVHLKSLLQLIAAAESSRELVYFTFGNENLCNDLDRMHSFLIENHVTIGTVWKLLQRYHREGSQCKQKKKKESLYDFLKRNILLPENSDCNSETLESIKERKRKERLQKKNDECRSDENWTTSIEDLWEETMGN